MIKRLEVSGLLSFGPKGIDLPMRGLNVLIGANGSGKSNFLEVPSLLSSAPAKLSTPVKMMGGLREWLWKGHDSTDVAMIDAVVTDPGQKSDLRHVIAFREHGGWFEVSDELIESEAFTGRKMPRIYYRHVRGIPTLYMAFGETRIIEA